MNNKELEEQQILDIEWVELILEAKKLGLTADEILHFLHNSEFYKYWMKWMKKDISTK